MIFLILHALANAIINLCPENERGKLLLERIFDWKDADEQYLKDQRTCQTKYQNQAD